MIDYSPEAIAVRLRQVAEARTLGISLRGVQVSRVNDVEIGTEDGAAPAPDVNPLKDAADQPRDE